jgi:hypothetical protein
LSVFCAAVLALTEQADAQNRFTVQQLYDLCVSADVQRQRLCDGYVAGVRHTLEILSNTLKQRFGYCIPPQVSNREIKAKFLDWTKANRNELDRAAVRGVVHSIFRAYPCKQGDKFEL